MMRWIARATGPQEVRITETGATTPPPGAAPGPAVLRYAAFAGHGRGGNPVGVVLDAAGLDDAARLAIAVRVGETGPPHAHCAFMYRILPSSARGESHA
jgi:hypothetical protein